MGVVSSIVKPVVSSVVHPIVISEGGAAPEPDSLLTDLVAWWSLDEASGTRVNAHNPGTHDLTDNNTVGQTTGVVGNAASFVAANNESLSCANSADLQIGDRDFSVCGWAKFTSASESAAMICGKSTVASTGAGAGWAVIRATTTETVRAFARNAANSGAGQTAAVNITYDTMFFYILQYTAATDELSFEVNRGTPVTVTVTGGSYTGETSAFSIGSAGASTNNNNIEGAVDNVVIAHRLWATDEKDRLFAGMAYPA
jgi:hypothetical protein